VASKTASGAHSERHVGGMEVLADANAILLASLDLLAPEIRQGIARRGRQVDELGGLNIPALPCPREAGKPTECRRRSPNYAYAQAVRSHELEIRWAAVNMGHA
jgi:hypothetical protein